MLFVPGQCEEYLEKVKEFAKQVGAMDKLQEQLDYLGGYACHDDPKKEKTRCELCKDFAPYSFRFYMYRKNKEGKYEEWFNCGLIYSGPRQPLNGSRPALTVSLDPEEGKTHGWSVHT
jgi:hypothetical protein